MNEKHEAEAKPAATNFWQQIDAMESFAKQQIETATETDFRKEFSPEIELHIFMPEGANGFHCHAYQIENGEATERGIKIF